MKQSTPQKLRMFVASLFIEKLNTLKTDFYIPNSLPKNKKIRTRVKYNIGLCWPLQKMQHGGLPGYVLLTLQYNINCFQSRGFIESVKHKEVLA